MLSDFDPEKVQPLLQPLDEDLKHRSSPPEKTNRPLIFDDEIPKRSLTPINLDGPGEKFVQYFQKKEVAEAETENIF